MGLVHKRQPACNRAVHDLMNHMLQVATHYELTAIELLKVMNDASHDALNFHLSRMVADERERLDSLGDSEYLEYYYRYSHINERAS